VSASRRGRGSRLGAIGRADALSRLTRARDGNADDYVLRALRAGAGGFLLRDTPSAEIVRAVRAVVAGEPRLSPSITRRLIGHLTNGEDAERRRHAREQLDRLTDREREVAVGIGLGKSNAEISCEL
jgi:DNA-binding NarL/FixJ family response regulator